MPRNYSYHLPPLTCPLLPTPYPPYPLSPLIPHSRDFASLSLQPLSSHLSSIPYSLSPLIPHSRDFASLSLSPLIYPLLPIPYVHLSRQQVFEDFPFTDQVRFAIDHHHFGWL